MIHTTTSDWIGDMALETTINGHKITMDADDQVGGKDAGPRPKPLLLAALSGCTAMDVISILGKKRVAFDTFRIKATAEMTETHPKVYTKIHLCYEFSGKDFANNEELLAKIRQAVNLSLDNYCGMAAMLKKICELTYEINLRNS